VDRFAALADPNRRRMLEMLGGGARPAGEIAAAFDMSPPAVSQHLKTLREAGLVRVTVDGQRRVYRLDPDGLADIDAWIDRVRAGWSRRLDALEAALAKEQGETR
jgi:DNA-binding transcriptional ArsR family regulator